MATISTVARPRRADAVRNYDALVQAALVIFADRGTNVALEEIAAAAGVGIGTLYRNFASREALVVAAYRQGVEQLCEVAGTLLAEHPADEALELWLERFVGYMGTKRELADALKVAARDHGELFVEVRTRIIDTMDSLLGAAARTGRIRGDFKSEDLIRAVGGICLATDLPAWQDQALRLLNLLMDGLRYGALAQSQRSDSA